MSLKKTVRERILEVLKRNKKGLNARTIAMRAKANYNTVRKELGILLSNMNLNKRTEKNVAHYYI
jgi:hypothetical protein